MFKLFGPNPVFALIHLYRNDLFRGCSHISSAGRHSAVTMPSCDICSIEAPSDKHLRMHIQSKHDARVRVLYSDMQRRDEAEDTNGFAQENYLQTL